MLSHNKKPYTVATLFFFAFFLISIFFFFFFTRTAFHTVSSVHSDLYLQLQPPPPPPPQSHSNAESDTQTVTVTVTENVADDASQTVRENVADVAPQTVRENVADDASQTVTENVADDAPQTVTESAVDDAPETVTESVVHDEAQTVKENVAEDVALNLKECDLFTGTWVKDENYPIYEAGSCPYVDEAYDCKVNGRTDTLYTKWRWKPDACDLPRFNATDFLVRLKGKNLMLVGDSMNRNQFESILCILREGLQNKSRMSEIHGHTISKGRGYFVFKFEASRTALFSCIKKMWMDRLQFVMLRFWNTWAEL